MLGKRNIYLIGPMGTGKTAVGKQLARLLRVPFIDSDAEIETARRASISRYIFEERGRGRLPRARARGDRRRCRSASRIVLATGGGAILSPENRQLLHDHRHRRLPGDLARPAAAARAAAVAAGRC